MLQITGSIWDFPSSWRVIPINTVVNGTKLVMGAGVAKQCRDRYEKIDIVFGALINRNGICVQAYMPQKLILFPTKNHWRHRSTYELIEKSTMELANHCDKYPGFDNIVMPRVGCGLGGLEWPIVRGILERYLDNRFTVVTNE